VHSPPPPRPATLQIPTPQVLAGFLRIVLEVINTILAVGLQRNPELVYAVLHKQVGGGWRWWPGWWRTGALASLPPAPNPLTTPRKPCTPPGHVCDAQGAAQAAGAGG
jgi:hypothetical protein